MMYRMRFKPLNYRCRHRGFSLIETMMAIGVSAFIFGMLGFLIFFSARNTLNIHEQIMSQTSAASASERITQELRSASEYQLFSGDTDATVTRLKYLVPRLDGSIETRAISYSADNEEVRIYKDAAVFESDPETPPTYKYNHIKDFSITWQSQFWIRTRLFYSYHGFALRHSNPGNPLYGQFITDVFTQRIFKFGV
jgi:hypothetical protein